MPNDEISKEKNGQWQPLVEHCLELYEKFKKSEYRKQKVDEIKEARKIYEQKNEKATFPWEDASNIILPLETITIDNMEPRLVAGLVGRKPVIQFDMEGVQEKDEGTELLENWFNDELEDTVRIETVSKGIVHDLLLEGTIYRMPEYGLDEQPVRDFQFDDQGNVVVDEGGEPVTMDEMQVLFEGGRINKVNFTDIFIPDDADDWEKTPVIRAIRPTYAELMRFQESGLGYMNIGSWLLKERNEGELTEDEQNPAQALADVKVSKETIECLECHISYIYKDEDQEEEDITDFTEERIVALIAKDKEILIRLVLLRDLNFRNEHLIKRLRVYPEKGRSYGTPVHGKMQAVQEGGSDMFNMLINSGYINMIPWFIYGNKSGLQADNVLEPGKGIPADDPNDVVFPKFNTRPDQYVPFLEMFFTLWEKITSIADPQIGRQKDKNTTATEWLGVIQEGNIKHNYQSKTFKDEFLSLLRTLYDLYYQYMPFDKTFNYQGQQVPVPRQAMKRKVKFILKGSTELANKMIERKESEDLYMMLRQDPNINPIKLAQEIIKSYNPDANITEYIDEQIGAIVNAIHEIPQLKEGVMQYIQEVMSQAQQMQGGGNAGTNQ